MNIITLDTYPDAFTPQGDFIENPDYDKQKRLFVVPIVWLADYVLHTWGYTLDEFFKLNDWDENWQLYEMAKEQKVLVSERTVER